MHDDCGVKIATFDVIACVLVVLKTLTNLLPVVKRSGTATATRARAAYEQDFLSICAKLELEKGFF